MAGSSGETIIIPRNFKLLEELEKAEKGNTDMTISYGLMTPDDIYLTEWQCTILGSPNSPIENRIITCLICAPEGYPITPPTVKMQSKVNYPFVNQTTGEVDLKKLAPWDRTKTIEHVLVNMRNMFAKNEFKKLAQPPDGTMF